LIKKIADFAILGILGFLFARVRKQFSNCLILNFPHSQNLKIRNLKIIP